MKLNQSGVRWEGRPATADSGKHCLPSPGRPVQGEGAEDAGSSGNSSLAEMEERLWVVHAGNDF